LCVCSGSWAKICDQTIAESKSLTDAQKAEERKRWERRQTSFTTVMIPKESDIAASQSVKDARAAEPRRSSIAV
jgi:hypothetical protein